MGIIGIKKNQGIRLNLLKGKEEGEREKERGLIEFHVFFFGAEVLFFPYFPLCWVLRKRETESLNVLYNYFVFISLLASCTFVHTYILTTPKTPGKNISTRVSTKSFSFLLMVYTRGVYVSVFRVRSIIDTTLGRFPSSPAQQIKINRCSGWKSCSVTRDDDKVLGLFFFFSLLSFRSVTTSFPFSHCHHQDGEGKRNIHLENACTK